MRKSFARVAAIGSAVLLTFSLGACSESKPSKEEYREALVEVSNIDSYRSMLGEEHQQVIDNYLNCIVDDTYDELPASTIQSLIDDGVAAEGTEKDIELIETATAKCGEMLEAELQGAAK
ncbi:hypothetical protein [Trueperella bialowiezensis]|uniref:Lipoprotein n=1 Tax=Trueperella bialowiezensis TaxID=312285 RepID=A0A448PEP0_9ACTO|nr:hypothetical protein [Trueperella bialowiezensis]VEI13411.1 Uncharacterised protein [Trueperella bialowiezensis]